MTSEKNINRILLSAISFAFIYIVARASSIDITHDEAYSFYNMKKFWYAEALCTGNTHWMNSLAIKFAILLKSEKLWQIRWFTILSAFVFLLLVYKWIKSEKEPSLKVFICAVLVFNPYIIDYFSIARGYAAGLTFQSLGLFLFFSSLKNENKRLQFMALVFSGLSAMSNFSFIYFFFAFCLIYFTRFYFSKGLWFLKTSSFYRDLIFSAGIAGLVGRAFRFMTKCSNDVVGAGTPFFNEFFEVVPDGLIYKKLHIDIHSLDLLGFVAFTIVVLSVVYGIATYRRHQNQIYLYSSSILLIILLVIFINFYAFKVVLPYYRSAVFLFPTTAICFIYFVFYVFKSITLKRLALYTTSILLFLNLLLSINFKWVFDFDIQANLKDSFDYTQNLGAKHVGISPELYGGFRNYYQMTDNFKYSFTGEQINTNLPKGLGTNTEKLKEFDYIILFPPYNLSYYRNNKICFKAEKIFKETGTIILKVEN